MSILIGIFTFILILVSIFLVLVILMQKSKSDGGMGAAMGGGMAESTFGAETDNVLSKSTINATIAFFVLSFGLYLAHLYSHKSARTHQHSLPSIEVPAAATPAAAPDTTAVPSAEINTGEKTPAPIQVKAESASAPSTSGEAAAPSAPSADAK